LGDVIDAQGLAAAQQRFDALRAQNFGDAYVSESQLNGLGYRYMGKDKLPEALAVLQWAVALFPNSGNVYDSLGEVQLKAGQRDAAKASYEKSLALDPKNDKARKVLAEMQAGAPAK
jgi:Tfp pilus assembly protein PilF